MPAPDPASAGHRRALLSMLLLIPSPPGMTQPASATSPPMQDAAPPFAADPQEKTSRLVEIAPGRRLHLVCEGRGEPSVILEAGLGDTSAAWHAVQAEVARVTLVCAYDRAGIGLSDPGPLPRTSAAIADDLHALLHHAGLPPPYVLVAHSMGALDAMLFADRHLEELAGLVLVDPSFADQAQILAPYLPEAAPHGDPTTAVGSEAESMSSASPGVAESDSAQLRAEARDLGALPIIVLTAADTGGTDQGDGRVATGKALWKAGHDALAARSRRGVSRVVSHAGHSLHAERPEAVAGAILEIVAQARAGSKVEALPQTPPGGGPLDRLP